MNEALQELKQRGFFAQCTDTEGLSAAMDKGAITFYVGVDPTGESLHVGHIVPLLALKHLVARGHRGIVLLGGGTARIGDPSGKSQMRLMLPYETIDSNVERIYRQINAFIGFDGESKYCENNKDWLENLNYIDFLRDIGACFSVNKMLSYEAYKERLERGLSFIEFNYQLLQSYDYLNLYKRRHCRLQIGGDDQWGNITAGIDLIRRKTGATDAYGLTFPLITRSDGKKMGKTEKGALFLDPRLVSPFEFFQYWRNVDDRDVRRFLLLFTFLSIEDIDAVVAADINKAKETLAYEVTKLIHGEAEASKVLEGARAAFSGGDSSASLPKVVIAKEGLEGGLRAIDLFYECSLGTSKADIRRLIQQGGASVNGTVLTDVMATLTAKDCDSTGALVLKAGKKKVVRVTLS